jgi:hypothetical protein
MADPLVPDIIEACSAFFPELDNNDLAVTSTKLGKDKSSSCYPPCHLRPRFTIWAVNRLAPGR